MAEQRKGRLRDAGPPFARKNPDLRKVPSHLPDARDGLSRLERTVLWVLQETQAERGDRAVPVAMLYGRVLEYIDVGQAEFQATLARLTGGRP